LHWVVLGLGVLVFIGILLAAIGLYWIFERVRRGEDEFIDRPVVSPRPSFARAPVCRP